MNVCHQKTIVGVLRAGPSVAAQTNITCANQVATVKAHAEWPGMSPLSFPAGSNPIIRRKLTASDEKALLGATVEDIADTIARLEAAFKQPPSAIFKDAGIETDFERLRAMKIPTGSPLSKTARAWWDPSKRVDIGPWDHEGSPSTSADFWAAFEALNYFNDWSLFLSLCVCACVRARARVGACDSDSDSDSCVCLYSGTRTA